MDNLVFGLVCINIVLLFFATVSIINIYTVVKKIKKQQQKHLDFLLKIKNDFPMIMDLLDELQDQIIPPENYKLN